MHGATLELPPLRQRVEDIPLLMDHFLRSVAPARKLEVPPRVLETLRSYSWPGNVRELRAEVLRWKVFCQDRVELDDVSPEILAPGRSESVSGEQAEGQGITIPTLAEAVRATEQQWIQRALQAHDGNVSRAAAALGIDRHTLKRKLALRA